MAGARAAGHISASEAASRPEQSAPRAAEWLGRQQKPVDPLHRVGGGGRLEPGRD